MSNYQLIENEPSWLELTKSEISVLRLMDEEMAKTQKEIKIMSLMMIIKESEYNRRSSRL